MTIQIMNKKGFTLLEVLIAVFVLAMMSMMIWQITNNAYRGADKSSSYNAVYQYGRVAMQRIAADLSMAYIAGPSMVGKLPDGTASYETSFIGEDQGDRDSVNFVTLSGSRFIKDEKKSDQAEVGYSIADCPDSEEKEVCLMRRESSQIDKEPKEGGRTFELAKGVKRFNLEYYDTVKGEWRADWSTKDPVMQNKLPRAARVTLIFNDPKKEDEEISFIASVMLPMSTAPIDF